MISGVEKYPALVGRGIEIKIVSTIPASQIKNLIEQNLDNYELLDFNLPADFPENIYVENISNAIFGSFLVTLIEAYYFKDGMGIKTNFLFKNPIKEKEKEKIFLKNVGLKEADLYYLNNKIQVRLRVKIIKRLSGNFYLIQCGNKIFRVKNEEEI